MIKHNNCNFSHNCESEKHEDHNDDCSDDCNDDCNDEIRDMMITEETIQDIMNEIAIKNYLADAFKFLRSKNMSEFRKIVSFDRDIINKKYNNTYLIHEACKIGDPDYVSLLLLLGAKCDIIDEYGMMAQHYAVKYKSIVIVDILSLFGNSMNVFDSNGNMPLYYAIKNNDEDMIKILMIYKADPIISSI
jgi:ankyrin repeat protein